MLIYYQLQIPNYNDHNSLSRQHDKTLMRLPFDRLVGTDLLVRRFFRRPGIPGYSDRRSGWCIGGQAGTGRSRHSH